MDMVFLKILNMSIAASWVVLAVLVLRFALKKAPKWITVALWALVAVRLVCPFSFESVLSLIPSTETLPEEFLYMEGEELHENAFLVVSEGSAVYESAKVELDIPVDSVTHKEMYGTFIWLGGMAVMALYALTSYLRLKKKVSASIHLSEQIFLCDYIDTPFILGMIKPKIYLPSSMDPDSAAHVLAHERAHLKRKDHWWKPLGFALLTIHWFNPVLWLAYILLCRDIEMACDEKVVREMGASDKKAYSEALLRCSVSRKMIAACPLAFGEVGVKERVKSVLNYKKPGFWIILVAVIALVIAAVCLLTDPVPKTQQIEQYFSSLNTSVDIMEDRAKGTTTLDIQFVSTSGPVVFLVEVQYKNKAEAEWRSLQLGKLQISESLEHVAIPGDDYIITVTPLEGKPGYATFGITKEGYKQDPQLKFDLPGPNVADMDVQEVLANIREFHGLDEEIPYLNSYTGDVILRENFDLELVFIPYFIDQDGKTYLSEAIFNDLAECCTLLGRFEWEKQNTRFLFEHYLNALKYLPQERIQAMLPNTEHYRIRFVEEGTPGSYNRVIRYSDRGIGGTDGWLIHLEVIPTYHENGGFYDTGEKPIHLFYGDEPVDDSFILDAKILEISGQSCLVEPMPGSWELNSADQVWVPLEADPMPQVGDILRITYDGFLMETYPAQIGEVFSIQVVSGEYFTDMQSTSFVYFVDENGAIIQGEQPNLIIEDTVVLFNDNLDKTGYYALTDGEVESMMALLEDVPGAAITYGAWQEDYSAYCVALTLNCRREDGTAIAIQLHYVDDGVNLRFSEVREDGSFVQLDNTYHIRQDALTAYIHSLCDRSRMEGYVNIGYPEGNWVEYAYGDASIRLYPLVGWEYEIVPYSDDSTPFGIRCRPTWVEDGSVFVSYWPGGFATCGTGLELKEYTGFVRGYYDGSENWSFERYTDLPGDYVVLNELPEDWARYADTVITMLDLGGLAEGSMQKISYIYEDISMSLDIWNGWEYEITEYDAATEQCGIRFRPEGEEGWLNLQWGEFSAPKENRTVQSRNFGFYIVEEGRYKGESNWRYIHFKQDRTRYTLWNEGADSWLDKPEYQEACQKMLDSIRVG